MWLLKEKCIFERSLFSSKGRLILLFWFFGAVLLASLCFTPWYVVSTWSLEEHTPKFGPTYFVYMLGSLVLFAALCRETILQLRRISGVSRLELQVLLLGACASAFAIIFLMAMRAILKAVWPIHIQPLILLLLYTATVVAITTNRIFDARQLILVATQKIVVVLVALGVAFAIDQLLRWVGLPEIFGWFVATGLVLWFAATLNNWLGRTFQFYPEAMSARQAVFNAARESRMENLEQAFCSVLKGWGQSEHAIILSGAQDLVSGAGIELNRDSVFLKVMRELKWVTPERLARERLTSEREEVAAFLKQNGLGALAISEGAALMVLVGVGVNAARLPFTYPQVTQLIELASIIESALERAHFSVKAQHAEQLATVGLLGASLAHEIRNPLVSIKTFVQLLPTHHQDPAFREKFFRLITDEVTRIDQLTEQLLDLASPRVYSAQIIDLHPVLAASMELAAAKAAHRKIQFLTDFQANPDRAFTDASAAKQVMLNLCFNAIQAIESQNGDADERWVRIATRNIDSGIEMAVADSGPGIAPEIRPKLFQPFQTTKSTGFGLGLAICSDILANLHATISVDPPTPGRGATFRVIFPCQPSSS
jgi:signal transduction histidine kinase